MKNFEFKLAFLFISAAAIFRLLPHPPNATPVAAMALMGGMYIARKELAIILPIIALFISDLILNNTLYKSMFAHEGFIVFSDFMIVTYLAFFLTVLLGFYLSNKSSGRKIIIGILGSSVGFFIITNFGTWLSSAMYSKNMLGLIECYVAAIPFFGNTLASNAIFITLFVVSFEAIKKYMYSRQPA